MREDERAREKTLKKRGVDEHVDETPDPRLPQPPKLTKSEAEEKRE